MPPQGPPQTRPFLFEIGRSEAGCLRWDRSCGVHAYLQLSFSVCYRWLFARAWWVSMEKALPQKQVPSRRDAPRRLDFRGVAIFLEELVDFWQAPSQ